MTDEDILAGINHVLRTQLGAKRDLGPNEELGAALELDSLRRLTLAVELENHFAVALDPADDAGIERIGDLVRLLSARLAGRVSDG